MNRLFKAAAAFVIIAGICAIGLVIAEKKGAFAPRKAAPSQDLFRTVSEYPGCTNLAGFASSCSQKGFRILKISDPKLSAGMLNFSLLAVTPKGSPYAISPYAYYWSSRSKSWKLLELTGEPYGAGSVWLKNTAWVNASIPQTEFVPGYNSFITWDYFFKDGQWTGPDCAVSGKADRLSGCWRITSVNLSK